MMAADHVATAGRSVLEDGRIWQQRGRSISNVVYIPAFINTMKPEFTLHILKYLFPTISRVPLNYKALGRK